MWLPFEMDHKKKSLVCPKKFHRSSCLWNELSNFISKFCIIHWLKALKTRTRIDLNLGWEPESATIVEFRQFSESHYNIVNRHDWMVSKNRLKPNRIKFSNWIILKFRNVSRDIASMISLTSMFNLILQRQRFG